jgi:glucose-6-phosphate isomerase
MKDISINDSLVQPYINDEALKNISAKVTECQKKIKKKTGKGSEFLGWVDLPESMLKDNYMLKTLKKRRDTWAKMDVTHVVVIGIGGSYLGTKAVYEALSKSEEDDHPILLFAGHHMSATYLESLCDFLKHVSFGVIVISKSGTTLEPALAFRILKEQLMQQFGEREMNERIIAITDKSKGALRQMADAAAWTSFVIEDSVGGRYSVLSPVGIVPLFIAGIDVEDLLDGAKIAQIFCDKHNSIQTNPALHYAALRYLLYGQEKPVEILASFQPEMQYMIEWWKQLFGESDGKNHSGIFPSGVIYSTDLHSMGQYVQEGKRIIFETFIVIEKKGGELLFPQSKNNEDGLNYLAGQKISHVNSMAEQATMLAHFEGEVPVIEIKVSQLNEHTLGQLIYFFEYACAIGGYLLDVNPFNQPGVEAYKNNMFALLGKPGMEEQTKLIQSKLQGR